MKNIRSQNGMSLVTIMIALAIVAALYMLVVKKYLSNPMGQDEQSAKALAEQGISIDSSNLPDTIRKAQEAADKASEANSQIVTTASEVED